MQKKFPKIYFHFAIIAFELVALNTRFYCEIILSLGVYMLTNSRKNSDITKKEFSELIPFQRD